MKFSKQRILKLLKTKKSEYWTSKGQRMAAALLKNVVATVPAYKKFFGKKTLSEAPIVNKKNYLRRFSYHELFREGSLEQHLIYTATSGSTSIPYYFARNESLDWQYSLLIEQFLAQSSYGDHGSILVVVAFGMGIWIGGLITYKAFEIASMTRSVPVSIITPGINKKEIFNIFCNLAPHYGQVILVGYPPFIKDILDEGEVEGINFKTFNMRLLFAAESFSETFRTYVAKKAGIKNVYRDTLNIYGSADIGAMAYETPLSILIRELTLKNRQMFEALFSHISKIPTFAQYNPLFIHFETSHGELLLTGDNAIPLVRYAIGDHGGTYSFHQIEKLLADHHLDLRQEANRAGITTTIQELPFVYVYERNDFSTTIYGLQVYPGSVRDVLMEGVLEKKLTGKLVLETQYDDQQNQYLGIHLELKRNVISNTTLHVTAYQKIITRLKEVNSEFRELSIFLKDRVLIKIYFHPLGDPTYFPMGIKQRWVKK